MVRYAPKPESDKEKKVTFLSKDPIKCPVCGVAFHREELFLGRVNAGELTDELHRTYIPMQAYGEVHPLVYEVTVCPSCWYAAYKTDFLGIQPKVVIPLFEATAARVEAGQRLFSGLDFGTARGLVEGTASYYLAMLSYDHFTKEHAPTMKQGMSALRAAWLAGELHARKPRENYDYVAKVFYSKARFLYKLAIEHEQKGKEQLATVKWLGPDTDKNYGYEGVLYLEALMELKYGPQDDDAKRHERLVESKRTIAKMFGLGKKSKTKPGPLVDKVRDLYDRLKTEVKIEDDDDE